MREYGQFLEEEMIEHQGMMCCGAREISGVQRTVDDRGVPATIDAFGAIREAFVILTGVVTPSDDGACGAVATYIRTHRLGEVTVTPHAARNPNTDNLLKVWVWRVNRANLSKWRAGRHKRVTRKAA